MLEGVDYWTLVEIIIMIYLFKQNVRVDSSIELQKQNQQKDW